MFQGKTKAALRLLSEQREEFSIWTILLKLRMGKGEGHPPGEIPSK